MNFPRGSIIQVLLGLLSEMPNLLDTVWGRIIQELELFDSSVLSFVYWHFPPRHKAF